MSMQEEKNLNKILEDANIVDVDSDKKAEKKPAKKAAKKKAAKKSEK